MVRVASSAPGAGKRAGSAQAGRAVVASKAAIRARIGGAFRLRSRRGEAFGAKGGKGGKVAAKFANPSNPQETWSGRGRPPRWLAAKLTDGAKLADFRRRVRKTPLLISGATGKGVDDAMKKLLTIIENAKALARKDQPGVTSEEWRP